jgi:short-subunit dehydrogenase
MPSLRDKTVIVTGASSGIGLAAARRFQRAGARLVVNARRREPLEAIEGATVVAGDVVDPAVRAEILAACEGKVHVLVNNAGYAAAGPVELVEDAEVRRQFDVNFFALAALTRAVLPGMRAARAGRIVNVSSVAGRFGYPLFGYYCATKAAVEAVSDSLRLEVGPWGIDVVLIEPGPVRTSFFEVTRSGAEGLLADAASPYGPHFAHADEVERAVMKQSTTADAVAAAIERACTAARPRSRYAVTPMAKASILLSRILPRSWFDAILRRQFRVPGPAEVG